MDLRVSLNILIFINSAGLGPDLDCRNISLKFKIFIIFNAWKKNSDLKAVYSPDSAL